jgi:general secretion pathway protein G
MHIVPARQTRRGFTLMEIIIVVAVLTLLAGMAVPIIGATLRVADTESTTQEMESIRQATMNFYQDTATLPRSLDDLVTRPPRSVNGWQGPYINVGLTSDPNNDFRYDAWRKPYQFIAVNGSRKTLRSWGENGVDDRGRGDDIDLTIDVTPVQRELTQQRLDAVNTAVLRYNACFRFTNVPPLTASGSGRQRPTGTWHRHTHLFNGVSCSHYHRHPLDDPHTMAALHGGNPQGVAEESVLEVPLLRPWANVLGLLRQYNLLPNDPIYNTDVWGNAFVCGPDPVQSVTSSGP